MELKDCITLVIDYRGKTPLKLGLNWVPGGKYIALSAKNIKTGHLVQLDQVYKGDEILYKTWMKDEVNKEDILITSEAPFGQVYFWNTDEKIILSQRLYCLRIDQNKAIPKYVYYYMCSKPFQNELSARATGSTATGLRQPELMACKIFLPSLNIQQHIVNTIGSVDDLIENYRHQVKKLIKIGDDYLLNNSKKQPIVDYANISLGGTPSRKKEEYWNGTIKWINSGAITGTPAVTSQTEFITELGVKHSATKSAKRGDSVLSIIEPSRNKVSLILDEDVYFNQSVICVSPKNKVDYGLIFFSVRYLINEIKGYATGAAQQSLNKEIIEKSSILIPEDIDRLNNVCLKTINIEDKIRDLISIKQLLLDKYFTNQ